MEEGVRRDIRHIQTAVGLTLLATGLWFAGLGWFAILKYWKWTNDLAVVQYLAEAAIGPGMTLMGAWLVSVSLSFKGAAITTAVAVATLVYQAMLLMEVFAFRRILALKQTSAEFWNIVAGFFAWDAVVVLCLIAQVLVMATKADLQAARDAFVRSSEVPATNPEAKRRQ